MDQDFSTQTSQPNNNLQFTGDPTPPPMTMGPTSPVSEKKGKTGLIFAILAVLVLCGGGAAAFFFLQKPAEDDKKTADQSQESKSEPEPIKITEIYKFKDRMTKSSYSFDDFKNKFSIQNGDIAFKLPTDLELEYASAYTLHLKSVINENSPISIYISTNETSTNNESSQETCKKQGDRTADNIKAGKFTYCKVLSEVGENGYDYFYKGIIEGVDANDPNITRIMTTYYMYFKLGDYYINYDFYTGTSDVEAKSVAVMNSIKNAFSLEDGSPFVLDIAAASLPTPMNKQLAYSVIGTINFNKNYYNLDIKVADNEKYDAMVYYKPLSTEKYTLSKHDEENDIDIYTQDQYGFFRFNQEKLDISVSKVTSNNTADNVPILTVKELKRAFAPLPDKK